MSSRVRIVAMHLTYGPCIGGMAHRYIEESWRKKYRNVVIEQVAPVMFATWPHWKKLLWMAKSEGKWDIKVFREPKGAKIRKSLYGKKRIELKLGIPKLRKKFKKPIVVGKLRLAEQAMYAEVGGNVLPVDPIAVAQAGRIYDLPAGWANQVVQQHNQQNVAFQDGQLGMGAQGLAGQPPQPPAWVFDDEVPPIEEERG